MNTELKLNYYKEPFPYIFIENILPQEIFDKQVKAFENFKGDRWTPNVQRYGEKIKDKEFIDFIENYLKEKVVEWCKEFLEIRNKTKNKNEKVPINSNMLKWDYGDSIKRCQDGVGYSIDIHSDIFQKVVTIIIYVNEKGSSTTLWNNKKNKSYNIVKKANSALIFVPIQGLTLHSVEKNDIPDRKTIQMVLKKI